MSAGADGRSPGRPNVLLIVLDATRAADLSLHGYERSTTPNLDRFAARAVVYERAIATSCWSLPCHASIFTGLYPTGHGADDERQFLDRRQPTMAGILSGMGYRTVALCEKRDLGPGTGMDRGFQLFDQVGRGPGQAGLRRLENGVGRLLGTRDAGLGRISRRVRRLLPGLASSEQPFFLFISTLESHIPYQPPSRFDRFRPPGVSRRQAAAVNQDRWAYMTGRAAMGARDFEVLRALYDAGIAYADAGIGRLLGWLEELRLLERTMVIITADHGENLGEHGLMAHGYCLYDTVVHVPLLIHYPRGAASPGRVGHQVQSVDLLPTVLSVTGASPTPGGLPGLDLLGPGRHPYTVAEQARPDMSVFRRRFPDVDLSHHDRELRMIRTDHLKLIRSSDGRHELYDLAEDPGELRNLIEERPSDAAELGAELERWQAATPRATSAAGGSPGA